jgi:carboxymethylenebutenolidase
MTDKASDSPSAGRHTSAIPIAIFVGLVALVLAARPWLPRRPVPVTITSVDSSGFQFESGGKPIRVDEFLPDQHGRAPAVFLLHGSGGPGGNIVETARDLAGHGYVAMVLHYFDLPGVQASSPENSDRYFVSWMTLVGDAIKAAGKRKHVDSTRIGLIGYSLGGYLALEVGATNPDVTAVVDYYGGMSPIISDKLERMPPTLLLHGEHDPVVPVAEARRLERLFQEKKVTYEIHIYPDQSHGFTGAAAGDARERTIRFLDKHLAFTRISPK